jgi:hypothetical protein
MELFSRKILAGSIAVRMPPESSTLFWPVMFRLSTVQALKARLLSWNPPLPS